MKKIFTSMFAFCAILLAACSTTQELVDEVSFAGMKKFYVEDSDGGNFFFKTFTDSKEVNAQLKTIIADYLTSKGFVKVDDKTEAQIIFRPLWSVSTRSTNDRSLPVDIARTPVFMNSQSSYVTLEIQAIIPENGKIWSWRGFSPTEIDQRNFTMDVMKQAVVWCLEKFPPEEYPSRLQEYKQQKEEKRIESEQNPYKEVLIKERERQSAESASK